MKPYIVTTSALFALLTLAHLWRMVVEPHLRTDPGHLLITAIGVALAFWGWRLLRSA